MACLAKEKVILSQREWQQLASVVAPGANRNVPLSAQAPSEQVQPVQAALAGPEPKPFCFHKCATATCDCDWRHTTGGLTRRAAGTAATRNRAAWWWG